MAFFSKLIRKQGTVPTGPNGQRAYVIGDIHGCMDTLQSLLHAIEEHNSVQAQAEISLIFLGDLIDRGPHSREVVEFLSNYSPAFAKPIFLMGNHEEVFLSILSGDEGSIASWFDFGGRSCARSYGVDNLGHVSISPTPILRQLMSKVPKQHINFISEFKNYHIFGDYLCVHAGIKPKVKLRDQSEHHFRWIRNKFLSYKKMHPYIVVHGHTAVKEPTHYGNRIAIDTGAGKQGTLTALCIDNTSTHFITIAETNYEI